MSLGNVPLVAPASKKQIELYAANVANELVLYPGGEFSPIDVPHLLEITACKALGLDIAIKDLDPAIEGITLPGSPPCIWLSRTVYDRLVDEGKGRDRFTGVHELAHGLMHSHQLSSEYCSMTPQSQKLYRRSDIPAFRDPEWQANKFAAYLLMPRWAVDKAVSQYGPNASLLADIFQMSYRATVIRLGELGYRS